MMKETADMKYEAVFFDLDGTLLDTSPGVIKAIGHVVKEYRLPELSEEVKRSFIGPPIQDSFERQYGLTKERAWEIATCWREIYKDEYLLYAGPYDGIYELLEYCHKAGVRTGVATNKREDYTRTLLDHFKFTPLFDCIAGTDMEGKLKKADLIRVCMERTGVTEPRNCLMVGDTRNDKDAAERAGVDFLGVTYGFGFNDETTEETPLAHSCGEIVDFLQG